MPTRYDRLGGFIALFLDINTHLRHVRVAQPQRCLRNQRVPGWPSHSVVVGFGTFGQTT